METSKLCEYFEKKYVKTAINVGSFNPEIYKAIENKLSKFILISEEEIKNEDKKFKSYKVENVFKYCESYTKKVDLVIFSNFGNTFENIFSFFFILYKNVRNGGFLYFTSPAPEDTRIIKFCAENLNKLVLVVEDTPNSILLEKVRVHCG